MQLSPKLGAQWFGSASSFGVIVHEPQKRHIWTTAIVLSEIENDVDITLHDRAAFLYSCNGCIPCRRIAILDFGIVMFCGLAREFNLASVLPDRIPRV